MDQDSDIRQLAHAPAEAPDDVRALAHAAPHAAPLRILHVVRQYAPGVGGIETYVATLAREQRRQGHAVAVLTLDRLFSGDGRRLAAFELVDGVPVRRVAWRGSHRYPLAPAILRHLKGHDIVHVHGVDSIVDMLAWTRPLHRVPLVLSTHGGFFHTGFAQRLKRIWFQTLTRASLAGVRAVLSSSTQDHARFAPLWPGRTALVENGVDTRRFAALARPGLRGMIYFGRLAPNKEIGRLLGWFAALRALDPAWTLAIAGRPMGVDPAALRAEIARLGLGGTVELYPSPTDEALRALIADASVYACASSYEGFGIAAVEAVSAGLYPVLSAIPAFARTRERIGFGTLVDFAAPPAPQAFLDDLAAWRQAPPTPAALAQRLAPFAWSHVADRVEQVYDRVLGRTTRRIGTVDICVLEREAAIEKILGIVAERRAQMIGFCNAHTVNVARRNAAFTAALSRELILNDGIGVEIASRQLYGRGFPSNLNGTDLLPELIGRLPAGTRLFLLGGQDGIAAEAGRRLAARFPNIVVAGVAGGFFGTDAEPALCERIAATRPDLVVAGMGQPRQELWAARNVGRLGVPVICVGAFMDFVAGKVPRAPRAVQAIGMEWAFRLAMEPRRLASRYLVGNITFLSRVLVQRATGRRGHA